MRIFRISGFNLLFALIIALSISLGPCWAQENSELSIQIDYESLTEDIYVPKGKFFRLLEDLDLDIHKRPYKVIGLIQVSGDTREGVVWADVEKKTSDFCIQKGADALINIKTNQGFHSPLYEDQESQSEEEKAIIRFEAELIVYMDKDTYGHMGFWYNNRLKGIRGIKIEYTIIGSPAERAGVQNGDVLRAISGENIGSVNIMNQDDYRLMQYSLKPDTEYQLLINRKGKTKVITIVPETEDKVFNWDKRLGGI